MTNSMYLHIKRGIDILVSFTGLVLLFPAGVVIAVLLWASTGVSPFFTQERPGKNGKIFRLLKFKTMSDRRDDNGNLLSDYERMTRAGRIVRYTSLDELPQLLNVLMGDMSLVGPRPLLVEYLPLYSPRQSRRHEVRPGMTGWAQVNGRNAISWEQKFDYDVWYVEHIGFALDMKILCLTPIAVLRGRGIEYAPKLPMGKFTGTPEITE